MDLKVEHFENQKMLKSRIPFFTYTRTEILKILNWVLILKTSTHAGATDLVILSALFVNPNGVKVP